MGIDFHWVAVYKSITYNYNRVIHETTRQTPFDVFFGPSPILRAGNFYDENAIQEINAQIDE